MYDITGTNKSFIGMGLNSGNISALDILWIRDSAIDGTGLWNTSTNAAAANEGKYLNRGQHITITGRGSVSYEGYKAMRAGTSGLDAISGSLTASDYVYPCRSTTFSFIVTPITGYEVTSVTLDGDTLTPTNGVYSYTVSGGNDKSPNNAPQELAVTFTKTGNPDVFLLGLYETGKATGVEWSANSTNNPDRVMHFASSLTMGSTTHTNVYYLDLPLTGNTTYNKSNHETVNSTEIYNGFKIYDTDLDDPWLGNGGTYTSANSGTYWTFANNQDNCNLTTISLAGKATYRFVYNPSDHKVYIYYPQIVTYDMNYDGDTDQQLAVAYGGTAKNITPSRAGYSFGGWYDEAGCTNAHDFTTAVTAAVTLYAKWNVNNATIKVNKTENGNETVISATSDSFSGITPLTVSKPASTTGYVFRGWVLSGDKASHVRLYTDAACTTPYTAGADAATIYVKSDGEAGITSSNVTLTAKYVTNSTVQVEGTDALSYFTAINGSTTNPQNIDFGSNVNVIFNNLSAGFGIKSVKFDTDEAVEYVNYGHYISFTMPAHNVHITDIEVEPYTCRITVKNADKVDIDGISGSGYYATGADVHTVTIKGSDDYHGSSTLTALEVKYIGGNTVTVNSSSNSADLTFDGYTLHVAFADSTATITGYIGGNVIITPTCSTSYNVNITSKVMSDSGLKYITYNKKSTTPLGEVESTTIAELKAYIKLTSAPAAADAADAAGVAWPLETKVHESDTYYLIEADEDGDYISKFPEGSKILLVTDDLDTRYQFIGWFPGSSAGPELSDRKSNQTTYEYTLDSSAFLYGVATRDIFVGGSGAGGAAGLGATWNNAVAMTYDAANRVYYYETNTLAVGTHYYFKLFDVANTGNNNSSGTTNQSVWYWSAKTIDYVNNFHDAIYSNVYIDKHHPVKDNRECEFHLFDSTYTNSKVRIYYKPSSQEVYIIPVYNSDYHELYLSNGRIDGLKDKIGLSLTAPTQAITGEDTTGKIGSDTLKDVYSYKRFTGTLATVNFQVTVNGSDASKVKVAGFVVYNMDTGEATTAPATDAGSNVWTGTLTNVSSNTFICPVYELTDAYLTANSSTIKAYEVFVNAADVDTNVWGDLVAMYVFGGTGTERDNNGAWPGQLMLPSGKTFSGVIYQKTNEPLGGVLFNNYNSNSEGTPTSFLGKFDKRFNYPDFAQTYDYAEPITLMGQETAADSMLLSFSLKQNNDGYRGLYYNSKEDQNKGPYQLDVYNKENTECDPGKAYDYYDEGLDEHQTLFDNYTFEYLTDKDGKNRLNLYGESVGSAPAGYYVICVGDMDYKNGHNDIPNTSSYAPNTGYNGQYSVEWYIYDANGVFLLHTLSDALYAHNGASDKPYVVDLLMASGYVSDVSTLSEKSVKISYEAPNTRGDATRFSGQWYANSTNEKVTVYAGVGMMTDGGQAIVPENPQSKASYGTSSITYTSGLTGATKGTINGLNWASLKLSDATKGAVTLTAATANSSTFKGWFSYDEATDAYTKVSDDLSFQPKFGADSRFFAMFSAQATYYFTYPGRNGLVTYSVKATTGAEAAEMSNGGILDKTGRQSEVASAAAAVQNAVRVFNHNVTFSVTTDKMDNSTPYQITVEGASTESQYKLTVFAYNSSGVLEQQSKGGSNYIQGTFGTAINLTDYYNGSLLTYKPSGMADKVFIGWAEYDGSTAPTASSPILSTQANFGYSITKDITIAPVFGNARVTTDAWSAHIDKNITTVEKTDSNNGKIYNDSIVGFRYAADTGRQLSLSGTQECGIIIIAQSQTNSTSAQQNAFNGVTANTMQSYLTTLKSNNRTSAKMNSTNYGKAYAFYTKVDSLSRLNRADIYQAFDYATFNGGQFKVMAYYYDGTNYICSTVTSGTLTPAV